MRERRKESPVHLSLHYQSQGLRGLQAKLKGTCYKRCICKHRQNMERLLWRGPKYVWRGVRYSSCQALLACAAPGRPPRRTWIPAIACASACLRSTRKCTTRAAAGPSAAGPSAASSAASCVAVVGKAARRAARRSASSCTEAAAVSASSMRIPCGDGACGAGLLHRLHAAQQGSPSWRWIACICMLRCARH